MKKYVLILFCCSTIWSCSKRKVDTSNSLNTPETIDNLATQNDHGEIQINANYPFGCADLIKYKYPKHWDGDLENYGQLKQPKGLEFENIGQCFGEINRIVTNKLKPEILELKHLKIGQDFLNTVYYDTITQHKIDSLKYRLPDIGAYQCYYFYEQSKGIFGQYGNLLLLDPKTKTGRTLNIYYEVGGDQHVNFRYFFLNESTIRIYEGSCYDDGCSLTERFNVMIKSDGQITIDELKK